MQRLAKLLIVGWPLLSLPAGAAEFTVDSTSNTFDTNKGDGVCEDFFGRCTLAAALDEANALPGLDTIILPAGIYDERGFIQDALNIVGAGPEATILDDSSSAGFVINTDQPVSISGLAVRNLAGSGSPSGIFVGEDGDVTLSDVWIYDIDGRAITTSNNGINRLTINNSRFFDNTRTGSSFSTFGGAMYLQSTGTVVINDSTISGNSADFGGAIYNKGAALTLNSSTVSDNSSTTAINVNGGFGGGGIFVSNFGSLTLVNSTISGNQATSSGGGIVIDDGTVALYSSTVTDNQADSDGDLAGSGGGIIATSIAYSTTNALELRNSIIADNSGALNQADDCSSTNVTITSFGYNLLGTGSNTDCVFTPATGDQLGTVVSSIDPLLAPLADNGGPTQTHLLTLGSPALDAGNPTSCDDAAASALTLDQRGFTRALDGGIGSARCDIGAVEMDVSPVADAGPDQVVQFGDTVNLDASGSSVFAGVSSYSWSENPTPSVSLNNASSATPDFVAPSTPGDLVFDLVITDNNAAIDSDSVTVTVNDPPVANAGSDADAFLGLNVVLDAGGSSDSDGSIDTYSWNQTGGAGVTLNAAATATADFDVDVAVGEVLVFELTTTDDTGAQDTDTIEITIVVNPAIGEIGSALKSAKKLQKKKDIKKNKKAKKSMKNGIKHLSNAISFYQSGDITDGANQVKQAIKDFNKVKKPKKDIKKLVKKLKKVD